MALPCNFMDNLALNCLNLSNNIQKSLTPFNKNIILCQETFNETCDFNQK